MGSYRQLTGQQTPPDRPDRVAPVAEAVEGTYFPYRGHETHGVPMPKNVDVDDYYETQEVDDDEITYAPEIKEEDVIPVRLVQRTSKERLAFRAMRVVVDGDGPSRQIIGRHEKRRSLRIRVHGDTNPLYIGSDDNVRPYTGFLIPAGVEFGALTSTEAVYACANPGTQVEVSVIYEYGVDYGSEI